MKIKKAIAGLASAIAMLGCIHTSAAADQLRFGIDPTFPPFESKNANGQLIGFDIDLGNAICAERKVQCSWVQNSFDGLIPALQAKKFDAILSSLSITDERKKAVTFTDPYYTSGLIVMVNKDNKEVKSIKDLEGKRIAAQSLSTIPGNIVARGLSHEFIQLNTIALEYARLINEFPSSPSIGKHNIIKAINDFKGFL